MFIITCTIITAIGLAFSSMRHYFNFKWKSSAAALKPETKQKVQNHFYYITIHIIYQC